MSGCSAIDLRLNALRGTPRHSLVPQMREGDWWARRDSNPHPFRDWNLNPARLPISPLTRWTEKDTFGSIALSTEHSVGRYGVGDCRTHEALCTECYALRACRRFG